MNDFKPSAPPLVRAETSPPLHWRVVRGPVGTGACLASDDPAGGVLFIAPPGVALQRPEQAGPLMGWRQARWQHGAPQDGVLPRSLEEVEKLVPSHVAWVHKQTREDQRLDAMLARAGAAAAAQATHAETPYRESMGEVATLHRYRPPASAALPDRRHVAVVTRSASTYSALTHRLPPSSAIAQVETFVASAVSASHLANELNLIALSIGQQAVRELVVSLLHARTRSHSWRYTWFLGYIERRSPRERRLANLVGQAHSAHDLLELLGAQKLPEQELDEILVNLLYAQNHGLRWKFTYPLRRALGSPRLRACRRVLRQHVQPRVTAARPRRSPHIDALPRIHS